MVSTGNVGIIAFCLSGLISFFFDILFKLKPSWISGWIKWCPTSAETLEAMEKEILSHLKRPYTAKFVNIGKCWEKNDQFVWTLKMEPEEKTDKTPLVLIHGFASGIGLWVHNLDSLSENRTLYAFDMLGFGRSSRPSFSSDPAIAEQQFATAFEMWRRAMGLSHMIILGHDIGGYIGTSFSLRHPETVDQLILVDPWGFPEQPIQFPHRYDMPRWVKFISLFINQFNFLAVLRVTGPLGPYLVDKFRMDLRKKFSSLLKNPKVITRYIYHCNAQEPSGEVGFKCMTDRSGWPVNPMINRINELDPRLPMVFIFGSRSWVQRQPALQIKFSRLDSFVGIQVVEGAGHHVYADQPNQFNTLIHKICEGTETSNISL